MTDKLQETRDLIQICTDIYYECGSIKRLDELTDEALDWHSKQIEGVLDRLLNGTTTIHLDTEPNNPVKSNIEPLLFKAEIKAAIKAERNKLKESK